MMKSIDLSTDTVQDMLDEIEGWYIKLEKEVSKEFEFTGFHEAVEFIKKIGEIAEKEGHYPDILLYDSNKVRISLSTHTEGNLTEKDFEEKN